MPGFRQTLHEWKAGQLHSGSKRGPVVRSQKQALAIAFSEAGEKKIPVEAIRRAARGKK